LAYTLYKCLDRSQFILVLAALLSAPPLTGGFGFTPEFVFRVLTISAFLIYATKRSFFVFQSPQPNPSEKIIRNALIGFSFFLVFVFLQWLGGHAVFTKFIPGTVCRYNTVEFLVQLVCYVLFFVLCLNSFYSAKRVRFFTFLLALEVVALVAIGYYQSYAQPGAATDMYGRYRVALDHRLFFASFLNPNHFGGFLVQVSLFLIATVFFYLKTRSGPFEVDQPFVLSFVFALFLLLFTASIYHAGARAALVLQFGALFLFSILAAPPRHRIQAFLAVFLFGLIYIGMMKVSPAHLPFESFVKSGWDVLRSRFWTSADAFRIFLDYPVFGTGLGSCRFIFSLYQSELAGEREFHNVLDHHAELLFSTGIIGYVLFITPILYLIVSSFKSANTNDSYWMRIHAIAALLGTFFIGVVVSIEDDYLRTPAIALLFILQLSILVRCGFSGFGEAVDLGEVGGVRKTFASKDAVRWAAAVSLVAALFVYSYRDWLSLRWMQKGIGNSVLLERSIAIRSDNPEAWVWLGNAYFKEAIQLKDGDFSIPITRSMAAYHTALSLAPTWSDVWRLLGRAKIFAGWTEEGIRDIAQGVALSPNNRNDFIYLIAVLERFVEDLPSGAEKRVFLDDAVKWLDKASRLPKPIQPDDFDYIGLLNIKLGIRLNPEDRARLLVLLGKYYKSETHNVDS
jgi:hypothetical protein